MQKKFNIIKCYVTSQKQKIFVPNASFITTVYQQNSGNAIYSYQVPYMHVHVMVPG